MNAAKCGNLEVVKYLVTYNADINAETNDGATVLGIVKEKKKRCDEGSQKENYGEIIKFLKSNGASDCVIS